MLFRTVSIQDNQSLEVLKRDKTEVTSCSAEIWKYSVPSCISWFTVTTVCAMITVFTPVAGDAWLMLADTADVSCGSAFSFTSFVKQCRFPNNNLLKSVQHLCHLRFCYATEWWLCLGKPRESLWVGFTKHSMLPAGCTWSEITYPLKKVLRVDLIASLHCMYRHHTYILSIYIRQVCTHLQTQAFKTYCTYTHAALAWRRRTVTVRVLHNRGSWYVQDSRKGRFR